jgi:hypothetical protein
MLLKEQVLALNANSHTNLLLPLSSFELDPYISIFLEPLMLEVELSELTRSSLISALCVGLGGSRVRIGKLQYYLTV